MFNDVEKQLSASAAALEEERGALRAAMDGRSKAEALATFYRGLLDGLEIIRGATWGHRQGCPGQVGCTCDSRAKTAALARVFDELKAQP